MAAGRLWLIVAFGICGWLAGLAAVRAADDRAPSPTGDIRILAIKPEHKSYKLIPIGETKIDSAAYRAVVDSLPRGLFGLYKVEHDEHAEAQQCAAACTATKDCDTYTYVRPDREKRVGVCHLQKRIVDIAAMKPVVELADGQALQVTPEAAPKKQPASGRGGPLETSPAEATAPAADSETEAVDPPPQEAQVADVEAAPATAVGPEHTVIYVHPTPKALVTTPAAPASETLLSMVERYEWPLLAAACLGALALLAGGLNAGRQGQRRRTLARLSTKIVTNGLDRQTVSIEGGETAELSLRFALRRSAAVGARNTDITIVPEGAPA